VLRARETKQIRKTMAAFMKLERVLSQQKIAEYVETRSKSYNLHI
jgi:hypothetical protein